MTTAISQIPADQADQAHQLALVRLHIWMTAWTHERLAQLFAEAQPTLLSAGDSDGLMTAASRRRVEQAFRNAWDGFLDEYIQIMDRGIGHAAAIAIGRIALKHDAQMEPYRDIIQENLVGANMAMSLLLQDTTSRVKNRRYSDQMGLSNRIWRLDNQSRRRINSTIANGFANGKTVWETSQDLEKYLGHDQDCPRWSYSRLRDTNPVLIAQGDPTGLISSPCAGNGGVAYNALRLARTEYSFSAHLMTRELYDRVPWITAEKINLSPDHPEPDVCDEIVSGGPNGNGVYPVGDVALPIHPHCLCYPTAVEMDAREFDARLRNYLRSPGSWPAMGGWKSFLGGSVLVVLGTLAISSVMSSWAKDDPDELDELMTHDALDLATVGAAELELTT